MTSLCRDVLTRKRTDNSRRNLRFSARVVRLRGGWRSLFFRLGTTIEEMNFFAVIIELDYNISSLWTARSRAQLLMLDLGACGNGEFPSMSLGSLYLLS